MYASSNDKITAASLESENEFYTRKKIVLSVNVNFAIFSAISVHRKKKKKEKRNDEVRRDKAYNFEILRPLFNRFNSVSRTRIRSKVHRSNGSRRESVADKGICKFCNEAILQYIGLLRLYK